MFKPLRDKILELAITGKLVPQLDSEPAVEQIGPAPAKDEEPFALPEKWKWGRLGALLQFNLTTKVTPEQIPPQSWLLGLEDIEQGGRLLYKRHDWSQVSSTKSVFKAGDVLYCKMNPHLNKVIIADEDGFCSTEMLVFDTSKANAPLIAGYLLYFLRSPFFVNFASTHSHGLMPRLGPKMCQQALMPVPPLEEQRRIVAKLDDIMGNLERMDQAYTELSGPMLKHFKNLVLQQAISGQLVPQLDSEPAVEQLGPAHKPEEVPFAIPEKWKWVALEDLFQFVDYRGKTPIKSASGVRLITSSNVRKGYLDHTRCEYISIDEYQSRQSRGVSHKGDILFTTEAPLGNVALADLDVFSVGQRVITLKSKGLALNECFVWFLLSNYFQTEILKQATGSTVQGIKAARLKKLVLPLPPIEEQKRIAARINKLFAEADKLLEWQQFA